MRKISRRSLIAGGAAALAAGIAGCGSNTHDSSAAHGSGHRSRARPGTTSPGTTAPGTTAPGTTPGTGSAGTGVPTESPPGAAQWAALASSLSGTLVRPGDPSYATDRELYDFRYDGVRPAGIAYCETASDVARCVEFARAHAITPTPRAGGHSYAGYSTGSGLVIDVTRMATVTTGRSAQGGLPIATIGAGARLVDVYSALAARGVSVPAGSCPTVGFTGLALGGGIGVVARAEGITSDRVESLTVVTADSSTLTASATDNPDLYWACRGGGGGNFGVVTSLVVETFPAQPVTLITLRWPWAAAGQVLPAWQEWVASAPSQMWSNCLLQAAPGSQEPDLTVGGFYLGTPQAAAGVLARLVASVGPPSYRYVGGSAFEEAMYVEAGCAGLSQAACHLPTQDPAGVLHRRPSLAKSDLLTGVLAPAAVSAVLAAVGERQAQGLLGGVAYDSLGAATARLPASATAWVHRDALYSAQYSVTLHPGVTGAEVAADASWLAAFYASQRPYVSGQAYQNYIDPTLDGWAEAYYGSNLPRLSALRRRYDPDGVWRFAQVIPR